MYNSENSYNLLGGVRDGNGGNGGSDNDIEIEHASGGGESDDNSEWIESRNRKRTRKNTGGASGHTTQTDTAISKSEYEQLSVDKKLSVLFTCFNSKMVSLEQKVSDCVQIHKQVEQVETQLTDHEKRLKLLEYKSLDLESRSRRNNLIIAGIPELANEDCFQTVSSNLNDKMGITPCPPIPRAHRLGRFLPGKTRPIIVYFLDTRDTEFVLSRATRLKGTTISINRDFPKEIVTARKALWPEYKNLRSQNPNGKVKLVYPAKLVNGSRVIKDMFPLWSTVMQGNRVTTHKQMFTNTTDVNTSITSTRGLHSNPPVQHVHQHSTIVPVPTANNSTQAQTVDPRARGDSTHSNHGTRDRSLRRVQSTSPGAAGRARRRARSRGRANGSTGLNTGTSTGDFTGVSASQPPNIGHRPWALGGRHQSPNVSEPGTDSTNL